MKIGNSQVELYSKNETILNHTQVETASLHYGRVINKNESSQNVNNNSESNSVIKIEESNSFMIQDYRAVYDIEEKLSIEDRIKKMILELLLEQIANKGQNSTIEYSKNFNIDKANIYYNQPTGIDISKLHPTQNQNTTEDLTNPYIMQEPPEMELKAVLYKMKEDYYQKESIDFSSSVKIQTPDQTYNMDLKISFSKELYDSRYTRIVFGDESFIDPLVINYDENVNPFDNISNLHFEFDLDNDGSTEMIPQLKNGAGYLALDKNENGKIDNGSELFGPNTNDGFKELAQYDTDNNNWIDENDAIFNKLKVWSIDEEGKSSLVSLIDSNVGAIYLGDIQSGFKYQSAIDKTDAVQKSNGIFVKEDGSGLGVVNSIDIVA